MSEETFTLPPGWRLLEFPSTVQILNAEGRVVTEFPKPYERGHTMGELAQRALRELAGQNG